MPVFPKRRFQHGALPDRRCTSTLPTRRRNIGSSFCRAIYDHSAAARFIPTQRASSETAGLSRNGRRARRSIPGVRTLFLLRTSAASSGEVVPVSTLFLTNRECPWRCVMCDLWKNTLIDTVPPGAIPEQIEFALRELPPARQIKLYNSGSFFDAQAIPSEDYAAIAGLVKPFERVIVECHPALIGDRCVDFRDLFRRSWKWRWDLRRHIPKCLNG